MLPNIRKSVSDIKTTFELNNDSSSSSSPAAQARSSGKAAGFLANMSPSKRIAQAQKSVQPSIDTVLDKAASVLPAVPQVFKKPSWIGPRPPERSPTPHPSIMQHPVTVEYTSPGAQPPVFICTDLSNPPWEPIEMESTQSENGEYNFYMTLMAEEGEYQYKLRLGPGDWWVCDGSKPKVDDGAGNENNLVLVKPVSPAVPIIKEPQHEPLHKVDSHSAPLMPHESNSHPDHKKYTSTAAAEPVNYLPEPHVSPLFGHESLAPPEKKGIDEEYELESPPLLRHESVSPTSHEQEHSPLFRHESIALDHTHASHHSHHGHHSSPNRRKHSDSSIPEEADPSDPSLEQFPTDHKGILEHLERARRSLDEDATSEWRHSPSKSPGGSLVANASPSLPSLVEGEDELDELPNKASTDEMPQARAFEPSDIPAAPITPPLTPDETDEKELVQKSVVPASIRDKAEHLKKKAKAKAVQAQEGALPALAVGVAFALAAAATALALWCIRARSDDITI